MRQAQVDATCDDEEERKFCRLLQKHSPFLSRQQRLIQQRRTEWFDYFERISKVVPTVKLHTKCHLTLYNCRCLLKTLWNSAFSFMDHAFLDWNESTRVIHYLLHESAHLSTFMDTKVLKWAGSERNPRIESDQRCYERKAAQSTTVLIFAGGDLSVAIYFMFSASLGSSSKATSKGLCNAAHNCASGRK